jgi:hypothetical protein
MIIYYAQWEVLYIFISLQNADYAAAMLDLSTIPFSEPIATAQLLVTLEAPFQ